MATRSAIGASDDEGHMNGLVFHVCGARRNGGYVYRVNSDATHAATGNPIDIVAAVNAIRTIQTESPPLSRMRVTLVMALALGSGRCFSPVVHGTSGELRSFCNGSKSGASLVVARACEAPSSAEGGMMVLCFTH